jgi:hypothetical protein
MENARRRDLVRECKERKQQAGAFAVRCAPSGQAWVGTTPNLDKQEKALWFMLRTGGYVNRAVQAAWNEHGADAFSFEILAELSDEARSPYALKADLKALAEEWRAALSAEKLVG